MSTTTDWFAWHAPYDELTSPLAHRLAAVQECIVAALDGMGPGVLRAVSIAAGQSRDLLPVLIEHPRGADVRARLVELDPRNADFAEGATASAGLTGVEVVVGDAGVVDTFAAVVPADLVLVCGVLDLLGAAELAATVAALPQLCAIGATVIWADDALSEAGCRHRAGLFRAAGFTGAGLIRSAEFTVGVHRLSVTPPPLVPGTRMFDIG